MRAYPWHALPRVTREQARWTGALADIVDAQALSRARETLASLLDVAIAVVPGPVGAVSASELPASLAASVVAVALERPGARVAIELDPSASLAAIDRVLGGEGVAGAGPMLLSPIEQGVLAFVAARACEGSGLVVADVLTTREGLLAWLGDGAIAWWSLTVSLGARASSARVWMPSRSLAAFDGSVARALPASIGDVGVGLAIRVGHARLPAGEVRSLGVGDVLLPDELAAERHEGTPRWSEARLVGRSGGVVVRLSRADEGFRVEGVERASVVRSATILEETMSEDAQAVRTDELSEVAEVPVELAIELGRIELRVRELAALVPGRVISARLPVGREVTLRAGDRVVAEGELVDIDGELGVRITRVARS